MSTTAAAAQPYFEAPWQAFKTDDWESGLYPRTVHAGDLNGDGYPDAVVSQAGPTSSGVRVMMNDGDGTYGTSAAYATEHAVFAVAISDLDGDGDLDLATASTDLFQLNVQLVGVLLNHGDGSLAAPTYFQAGPHGANDLLAADLDGDGDADLATANFGLRRGSTVSVLLNDGAAAFSPPSVYEVGDYPHRLEAGDLDKDGDLDLAIALETKELALLFNDGTGVFSVPAVYDFGIGYSGAYADAVLIDVDNDGDLDVAYSNTGTYAAGFSDPGFLLLHNDGSGALAGPEFVSYHVGSNANVALDLEAVDLNGDGASDLVGAQRFEFGILTVLSDGTGGFNPGMMIPGGETAEVVAVADADVDGHPDVLTVSRLHRLLNVHLNEGDGSFPRLPVQGGGFGHTVVHLGDADNDGDLDAVTSHFGAVSSSVKVYLNDGVGGYAESYTTPDNEYGHAIFADLNGDGVEDLLFTSGADAPPYDFFTAAGNGDGSYQPTQRWDINTCGSRFPTAFDMDHDGDLDVLVGEDRACMGIELSGRRIFVSENTGDGTFEPPYVLETGNFPINFAVADFDEDGHLDFATAAFAFPSLHLGNGDGTFRPFRPLPAGQVGHNIVAADLNGDGHVDLAAHDVDDRDEAYLSVMLGDGAGGFSETEYPDITTQRFQGSWIQAGDVDGDGDLDLMESGVQDALVHLNDGAGLFTFEGRYGIGRQTLGLAFGDADGDEAGDLLSMGPSGDGYGLLKLPGLIPSPPTPSEHGRPPAVGLPGGYALSAAYPNPFSTNARFTLEVTEPQVVTVTVFDGLGRRVSELFEGLIGAGESRVFTLEGSHLTSGVYLIRVAGDTFHAMRQAVVVK